MHDCLVPIAMVQIDKTTKFNKMNHKKNEMPSGSIIVPPKRPQMPGRSSTMSKAIEWLRNTIKDNKDTPSSQPSVPKRKMSAREAVQYLKEPFGGKAVSTPGTAVDSPPQIKRSISGFPLSSPETLSTTSLADDTESEPVYGPRSPHYRTANFDNFLHEAQVTTWEDDDAKRPLMSTSIPSLGFHGAASAISGAKKLGKKATVNAAERKAKKVAE